MIKYHGTPLTPVDTMLRVLKGKHAMVSYQNPEQIEEAAEVCQSVVLDNGAFSAWKAGEVHDFAGYLEWATFWLKHPAVDWAVIPDVIDGDEVANDAYLAKWPLPAHVSVPVYHMHESLDRLDRLVTDYPRVALGSSGKWADPNTPSWWTRISEMMKVACDAEGMPRAKLHGLRMLDTGIFSRLPLASADSTNVARNIGLDVRWKGHLSAPAEDLACNRADPQYRGSCGCPSVEFRQFALPAELRAPGMTVVTADLVEAHKRIGLLESLVNHLRTCGICAEKDVLNCELGKKLWDSAKPDIRQARS